MYSEAVVQEPRQKAGIVQRADRGSWHTVINTEASVV